MKNYRLELTVFLCGAVVMMLELTGSRMLAPALGTSTFVWTSLIGIVLAALSVGYWWGGRLSDQRPEYTLLAKIIFYSAVYIFIIGLFHSIIVNALSTRISDLRLAAVTIAILLFAPPAILLGMVSPFAIRLKIDEVSNAGKTAGVLYAISTVGSIAGTFITGFYLLSVLGTVKIIYLLSGILLLVSLLVGSKKFASDNGVKISLFAFLLLGVFCSYFYMANASVIDVDTQYNRVIINTYKDDDGREIRNLFLDPFGIQSAVYVDSPEVIVSDYINYYDLFKHFAPQAKQALMLGGAAYTYPRHFITTNPNKFLDAVEIDPALTELAKKHFFLENSPNLKIFHEDARTFLNKNKKRYDAIFIDVFNSAFSVPFHLATKESATLLKHSMAEDGVIIMNTISPIKKEKQGFLSSLIKTFETVFPKVTLFRIPIKETSQTLTNYIIVAQLSKKAPLNNADSRLQGMLETEIQKPQHPDSIVLTDNFSPVEQYMFEALQEINLERIKEIKKRS